jgi:hypothetical protein
MFEYCLLLEDTTATCFGSVLNHPQAIYVESCMKIINCVTCFYLIKINYCDMVHCFVAYLYLAERNYSDMIHCFVAYFYRMISV